ncbi:MAG: hypothetical protein WCW03_03485 [Candidatus Paceibacterota bacterium]|jgi:hypothetical protein
MTTIINTPSSPEVSDNSGVGVIVGILITVLIVILFVIFGLPYLRNRPQNLDSSAVPTGDTTINVTIPSNPVVPTKANTTP